MPAVLSANPPLPVRESPVGAAFDRFVAVVTILAAFGFVFVLSLVEPRAEGHGTHELLGMEPCGWPALYGMPCPTCGVTTAATHLVHLDPIGAFLTQPFGAILAGFGLWLAGAACISLARGHSFVEPIARWNWPRLGVITSVVLLASWGYKILVWPAS
jgi:hypothetical protein